MVYITPIKCLSDESDLEEFKHSESYKEIISFVKQTSESIQGVKITDDCGQCPILEKFCSFMLLLSDIINEIPPSNQPMRYGNKAFRDWHRRMINETDEFLDDFLPTDELKLAKIELLPYLTQSFGNETRIDYGTGHELSIILFFLCLYKLGVVTPSDFKYMVIKGFGSYIKCVRKLQEVYLLEPAGQYICIRFCI